MKKFLVGIDGSNEPDPNYWRARNEFITAETPEEAKEIWCYIRSGWLRSDEIPFVQVREVFFNEHNLAGYSYNFTKDGIEKAEE